MTSSPLTAPGAQRSSPRPSASTQQTTIDYLADMHLYQQLAQILRNQIRSGQLPPGRTLPPIDKLAKQHKIARRTVRHGIAVLEGWLSAGAVAGRGPYPAVYSAGGCRLIGPYSTRPSSTRLT
jgi:GntR family transcriptional regulator